MATLDGALKLSFSCGDVPVKSISAVLCPVLTRTVTLTFAWLSSSYSKWPSCRAVMTRLTDSAAFSWTWPM
jgi:hypothetical protein